MTKLNILLFLLGLLVIFNSRAADDVIKYNHCNGAINIFENGDFELQFTGDKSGNGLNETYPSLSALDGDNFIWVSFIAPADGELSFEASIDDDFIQMVVFEEDRKDICSEINQGISEIKRMQIKKQFTTVGLGYSVGGGMLYALPMRKGKKIQLLLSTTEKTKSKVDLHWNFNAIQEVVSETKIVDMRDDDFAPTYSIRIIDRETQSPIIADLVIDGKNEMTGLYNGSEFYFNVTRNNKLLIKCDLEGYFFEDIEAVARPTEDGELVIELERLTSGKAIQLEEIEFQPGTSEITPASEPKLQRLYDFLALNSDIKIEIQGHVFALGKNTFAGQKVSEARAKRVMKYLIEKGIDKDRLKAVGYGNTRPIYPEPKFSYEEQANRRVEIVIL